jgi:hypothetical protein
MAFYGLQSIESQNTKSDIVRFRCSIPEQGSITNENRLMIRVLGLSLVLTRQRRACAPEFLRLAAPARSRIAATEFRAFYGPANLPVISPSPPPSVVCNGASVLC